MSKAVKLLLYIGILSHDPTNAMISCSAIGKFTNARLSFTKMLNPDFKSSSAADIDAERNRRRAIVESMEFYHKHWPKSEKSAAQYVDESFRSNNRKFIFYRPDTDYDLCYWLKCLRIAQMIGGNWKDLYTVHLLFKEGRAFLERELHPIDMALDMLVPLKRSVTDSE